MVCLEDGAALLAWRFGDWDYAQDTADAMNSTTGNSTEVHVVERDGEGSPLTL
jgi:hypothetical protein